ncbi:MAG TPA: 4a-hydroxytetrahydrobiopterin dehydratase [Gemmatimonadota bacterium]|nr:4a-hydroxytetrahydrobiopterin dehydratase [Gemmatimonadota bacterium]
MVASELANKNCTPCRGGIPPLAPEEARQLLVGAAGWELEQGYTRLQRSFKFETFPKAIEFVVSVAQLAEEEGHHPDFAIHYREVTLVLYTHAIGGLHENDFIMAAKINQLVGK